MTKEELQIKIDKIQDKIIKINKRINKWSLGMNDEAKEIAKKIGYQLEIPYNKPEYVEYKNYVSIHSEDPTVFNKNSFNKGPQLNDLKVAYNDLFGVETMLHKYETKLIELNNFDKEDKIQIIVDFLNIWAKETYNYYEKCAQSYAKNTENYYNTLLDAYNQPDVQEIDKKIKDNNFDNESKELYKIKREKILNYMNSQLHMNNMEIRKSSFVKVNSLVESLTKITIIDKNNSWNYRDGYYEEKIICNVKLFDNVALNKIIEEEKKIKYKEFVSRITEIVGNIQNASNLSIGEQSGEINGIVIGDKGKARVETIGAGGYNENIIVNTKKGQCFHYRVLVHKIGD